MQDLEPLDKYHQHTLHDSYQGWGQVQLTKYQIMSLFKSQDYHILCRVNLEWTKYRGIKVGMVIWHQDIFSHHLKR